MKQMKDLVSIVIPVYRVEEYLNECIDSVVNQSYTYKEIFVIDDGSDDQSGSISDEYAILDSNLITIHKHNGGLSSARNTGIFAATGKYIYFIDSDDYLSYDAIEKMHITAEKEKADMVFIDANVVCDVSNTMTKKTKYKRERKYPTQHGQEMLLELLNNSEFRTSVPTHIYKRRYLDDNKLRFVEGVVYEDELFSFFTYYSNGIVAQCSEQLYFRRIRPDSIMTRCITREEYFSIEKIYYELVRYYELLVEQNEVFRCYIVRIAKYVIHIYNSMDYKSIESQESFSKFKHDVIRHSGFEDYKLKIKCSGAIRTILYKCSHKLDMMRGRICATLLSR